MSLIGDVESNHIDRQLANKWFRMMIQNKMAFAIALGSDFKGFRVAKSKSDFHPYTENLAIWPRQLFL
jgi:hypothetical protein